MSLNKIMAEDYGQTLTLTIKDTDTNAAADISTYTTSQAVYLMDPDGNISAALSASFDTDGSDGVVTYTLADGNIDENGLWHICARVTSGSAVLTSEWKSFLVGQSPE